MQYNLNESVKRNKGRWLAMFLSVFIGTAHAEELVNIEVPQSGVYRLTHTMLMETGLDLRGMSVDRIGLKQYDEQVPIRIYHDEAGIYDDDTIVEYVGTVAPTMYQESHVYTLTIDEGQKLIQLDERAIDETVGPAYSYLETRSYAPQNHYSTLSPDVGDAWYADRLRAIKEPVSKQIELQIDEYAPAFNTGFGFGNTSLRPVQLADVKPRIQAHLWGASNLPGNGVENPDHLVRISMNGSHVLDKRFDGLTLAKIDHPLPELSNGTQFLEVTLPFTHGYNFDIVDIDRIELSYPRRFVAKSGQSLIFPSKWRKFRVRGLQPQDSYTIYRQTPGGQVYKMAQQQVNCTDNTCWVIFAGEESDQDSVYYVFTESAINAKTQQLSVAPLRQDIISGQAEYVLISHPDFINTSSGALAYLKNQLNQKYSSVDVIDVDQIYAQYSGHRVDAQAIYMYLKEAYEKRGTRYVTLVGDDIYDYLNYSNSQAKSYIPSLYVALGHNMNFVPSDAKYADVVGDDDIPDIAISRLPVRTENDLLRLINKRYQYLISQNRNNVVLSADKVDGNNYSFKDKLNQASQGLFSDFNVNKVFLDDLAEDTAKTRLINAINSGASLVTYFGHSSVDRWSFSNLLSSSDISLMTNNHSPTIMAQLGCWNNYYVNPNSDSIGSRLLLQNDGGAVTVMGPTTLTQAESENRLAQVLLPKLSAGMPIGDAILTSKQALAESNEMQKDILLGWSILGFLDLRVAK